MGDDSIDSGTLGADELGALAGVREALEGVEREQRQGRRERGRLRDQLEGLLGGLRATGVVLCFDAGGTLTGAEGAVDRLLGISSSELLSNFDDIAPGATREAIVAANRKAAGPSATLVESYGSLRCGGTERAFQWMHVARWDVTGELVGVDVIGLPLADSTPDDGGADGPDPFEAVFVETAQRIIDDPSVASIESALATFGESFATDRVVVNSYDEDDREFSVRWSWLRGGTEPLDAETRGISIAEIPWAYAQLGAGELVVISAAAELPPDAAAELDLYAADGVTTALLVPILRREVLCGFVSLQSVGSERDWSDTQREQARRLGMLLSGVLTQASSVAALEAARNEGQEAVGRAEQAERKAEHAESMARDTAKRVEEISSEAETSRSRVAELEAELETARQEALAGRELVVAADTRVRDAEDAVDDTRSDLDGERQDVATVRRELEELKEEAERAQRRSEVTAADALVVRSELEEARAEAGEARREAADARVALQTLRDGAAEETSVVVPVADSAIVTPEDLELPDLDQEAAAETLPETSLEADEESEAGSQPDSELESDPGLEPDADPEPDFGLGTAVDPEADFDPEGDPEPEAEPEGEPDPEPERVVPDHPDLDATVEMGVEEFDPDATLEIEPRPLGSEAEPTAPDGLGNAEKTLQIEPTQAPEPQEGDLPRALGLNEILERTPVVEEPASDAETVAAGPGPEVSSDADETPRVPKPAFLGTDDPVASDDADSTADEVDEIDEIDFELGETDAADSSAEEVLATDSEAAEMAEADSELAEAEGSESDREETVESADVAREVEAAQQMARQVAGKEDEDEPAVAVEPDDEPAVVVEPADEPAEEVPAAPAVSALPAIDQTIGLQDVGGNVELYHNLLSKFRQDYLGAAARIESAIAKGNIEVAHLLLHAVKGVAGMLGAQRVRSTAEDLETNLIGNDETTTQVALDAFTGALEEVLESIAALDGGAELPSPEPEEALAAEIHVSDPMVLRSYLSGLRQHLLSEKSKQCQLVMREITARTWPGEFNEQVAELAGLIGDDRFEEAREAFDALMSTFEDH